MGDEMVTVQNLRIRAIDTERSLLLIEGAIPGPKGGHVTVSPAVKKG
jgi:large subunit ribosomal protein L3